MYTVVIGNPRNDQRQVVKLIRGSIHLKCLMWGLISNKNFCLLASIYIVVWWYFKKTKPHRIAEYVWILNKFQHSVRQQIRRSISHYMKMNTYISGRSRNFKTASDSEVQFTQISHVHFWWYSFYINFRMKNLKNTDSNMWIMWNSHKSNFHIQHMCMIL